MVVPELISINTMSEIWGEDVDDFYIQMQADIGPKGSKGSETFTFYVVSPKRLHLLLEPQQVRLGRGLLIMNDFNKAVIEETIRRLLKSCSRPTWDEVALSLSKYTYWEFEDYSESNF